MHEAVAAGFQALGEYSGDAVLAERFRIRVNEILVGQEPYKDPFLAKAYRDFEEQMARRRKDPVRPEELRRRASDLFREAAGEHPAFVLMFVPVERQCLAVAGAFVSAYGAALGLVYGPRSLERLLAGLLADTPWGTLKVSSDKGVEYDPVRMRSLPECVELVSALLDRWYGRNQALLGDEANRRIFEKAFHAFERRYGFLPTFGRLLGATPRDVLAMEKIRRLHDLETETTVQKKGLRAADEDLRSKAEQLRRTVDELEETKRRLEAVSQARSEFIDVVSHQFRTPLSSIRWNAELLVDGLMETSLEAEYKEAMMNIRTKSVYLIETLDRVFATLDIETGKVVLDRKPAFLWEIVQDVYGQFEKDIKRLGFKWTFKRTKEQVREIPVDKQKISTVLRILLGNAVMYNKEKGRITVDVAEERLDGKLHQVCTVADDGIGLSAEDKERVFEKFYRSKEAILKVADGTGLGLFIVRHFVEAHGGRVWVESAGVGKGTTVAFALPVE